MSEEERERGRETNKTDERLVWGVIGFIVGAATIGYMGGRYDVVMSGPAVVRINTITGKAWLMSASGWEEIEDHAR